ncbi:unnamed protein product [Urochloa decumbens]|uniref:Uncharacterized protein n=1 Tax=Urochloa decumbens TaxID=240449 RepID=A0ABC9AG17_9POAL
MLGASAPRPSPHLLLSCFLLLVLLVYSPHSSEARTSPDVDLAGDTLQYGARKLLVTENPVTPSPPAPVSGPPIGPGLVVTPPPSV